ncbi:GNAT family N-acetyltransferase [Microbacterium sp. 22242]|uniref:GNAT family N-acetyltransferase n=1 Tax=Microbacterium sp. 22242 TaxID=3453896 RepID=UPI003F847969
MTPLDPKTVPADAQSAESLRAAGLEYRVVELDDEASAAAFVRAVARGFLDKDPSPEAIAETRDVFRTRRDIGVFDPGSTGLADVPIATVNSFETRLSVPGGEVPIWAISAVTVNPTHRRRGVARAMLEGELRSAAAAGAALAGLTVTEATIYGRYGFGPAVPVASFTVDARRAGWSAVPSPGRLDSVEQDVLADALAGLHERLRPARAGQVSAWPQRWAQLSGLAAGDASGPAVRGVRYVDADGAVQGAMAYLLEPLSDGFGADLTVRHLAAATPEAMRALWCFAVTHDLVRTVRASLRPVDDPLPWLVADQRAVQTVVHDHGWLRILDVPAALQARRYRAPLDLVLRVSDPLGFADGAWRVRVGADGKAHVAVSADAADLELDVAALSALYLGGVSATTLRAAGRVGATADAAEAFDHALGAAAAPALTIWY